MNRRRLLAAVGTLGTASLAGCTLGYTGPTPRPDADAGEDFAELGFPSTICEEELRPNLIPAIDDPVFAADWSDPRIPERFRRTGGLTDDRQVVGIERGGVARAYPLAILRRNEVVNDTVGGPLLVTYCPLCRSGLVARREVDSEPTTFGVSGLLWKPPDAYAAASEADGDVFVAGEGLGEDPSIRNTGNLVLYDVATESRWSQLAARAICGPKTGTDFEILPSTVATWGEWKAEYPDTEVLLPPPISGTL
ncbi:DUF3179 domain-containing protein [Salinirubellus salinus]|uniref:DUF3179 domain-containing protein n=1 Tax=Salinirubellus salinus TaxID=1364945 RepID=A0A9E7R282_9EURY|nr:DUF3179 domain-containing protein [Salinirubellus salinus]UWM53889.1 DUF3179 domain-containing protein [Salinirubellus salinus]